MENGLNSEPTVRKRVCEFGVYLLNYLPISQQNRLNPHANPVKFARCLHLVHHLPLPPLELGIHLPSSPHKVLIKGHSEPDGRKEIAMDWKSMRRTLLIWMPLGSDGEEIEEKRRFLESLDISMIGNVCT